LLADCFFIQEAAQQAGCTRKPNFGSFNNLALIYRNCQNVFRNYLISFQTTRCQFLDRNIQLISVAIVH